MAQTSNPGGAGAARGVSLVKIGGALAVAGTLIGTAIFVVACFGFGAAFALSPIPLILGSAGLVLTLIGGCCQQSAGMEAPQVLAALLVSLAVVLGALLEIAIWLNVAIFATSGAR